MSYCGQRRVVGPVMPVLYPGEQASGQVELKPDGTGEVTGWLIEPMPGWDGWRLRMLYRLFGWLHRGEPARLDLEARITLGEADDD